MVNNYNIGPLTGNTGHSQIAAFVQNPNLVQWLRFPLDPPLAPSHVPFALNRWLNEGMDMADPDAPQTWPVEVPTLPLTVLNTEGGRSWIVSSHSPFRRLVHGTAWRNIVCEAVGL